MIIYSVTISKANSQFVNLNVADVSLFSEPEDIPHRVPVAESQPCRARDDVSMSPRPSAAPRLGRWEIIMINKNDNKKKPTTIMKKHVLPRKHLEVLHLSYTTRRWVDHRNQITLHI